MKLFKDNLQSNKSGPSLFTQNTAPFGTFSGPSEHVKKLYKDMDSLKRKNKKEINELSLIRILELINQLIPVLRLFFFVEEKLENTQSNLLKQFQECFYKFQKRNNEIKNENEYSNKKHRVKKPNYFIIFLI